VGTQLATDHHYNVPVRLQIDIESIEQKFSPINEIFTMMKEQHQLLTHWWTYSTSNKDWGPLAQELLQQFDD
jgi:hypothetical protein